MKSLVNKQGNASFPELDIAMGNIAGVSVGSKFGRNRDIDSASAPQDIWDVGGIWVPPTIPRIHTIQSTSAADTAAGTGARVIVIEGLDSNWAELTEEVTMSGTTATATVNEYVRIFRAYVKTAGTGLTNDGDITGIAQTDLTTSFSITAGVSQTEMAIYTIPAGKTGFFTERPWISMNRVSGQPAGAMANILFRVRFSADQADSPWRVSGSYALSVEGSSISDLAAPIYLKVPEKTDIVVRCESVSDNSTDVSAGFQFVLVEN